MTATRLVLDRSGPCVLVGHSYGGMIISEVGGHASVRSLVYVAAFQPEVGESAGGLQDKFRLRARASSRSVAGSCR